MVYNFDEILNMMASAAEIAAQKAAVDNSTEPIKPAIATSGRKAVGRAQRRAAENQQRGKNLDILYYISNASSGYQKLNEYLDNNPRRAAFMQKNGVTPHHASPYKHTTIKRARKVYDKHALTELAQAEIEDEMAEKAETAREEILNQFIELGESVNSLQNLQESIKHNINNIYRLIAENDFAITPELRDGLDRKLQAFAAILN